MIYLIPLSIIAGVLVFATSTLFDVVKQIEKVADELMGIHNAIIAEQVRRDEREKRYET